MYDLRRLQHLANGARLGAVLALGLAHLQVSAQGAGPLEMPQRLDRFHVFSNGNIVSNKYASDVEDWGMRMAQHARVYGTPHPDVGGGVSLSKQLAINTRNGVVVAEATQRISARQIAKGIASVAGGPLGVALLAAPVILDLLDDAGLSVDNGQVMKPGASGPNAWSPFPSYSGTGFLSLPTCDYGSWYTPGYCRDGTLAVAYVDTATKDALVAQGWFWQANNNPWHRLFRAGPSGQTIASSVPATATDIENAVAAANPGPAALKELADKGGHAPNPDPADKPKIQNPQPSQEKVTTKTNPDGSSETTSCRTNGTPTADGSIKLTESCTITKKDAQGNPTGTTTTTSDDADPVAKPDDSLLCSVFPNIAACAELDTPEGDIPTASETIGYTAENHFGGGSCPADKTMTLATTGQAMTVWNWSQACNAITDYFRPLFITLCTLTALFILAPGVKEGA